MSVTLIMITPHCLAFHPCSVVCFNISKTKQRSVPVIAEEEGQIIYVLRACFSAPSICHWICTSDGIDFRLALKIVKVKLENGLCFVDMTTVIDPGNSFG